MSENRKPDMPKATKVMLALISVALIVFAVFIYKWRFDSMVSGMTGH